MDAASRRERDAASMARVLVAGSGAAAVECVLALRDLDGFLEIDEHGRVCDDVFAAGDATAFPIKHGSLAAAQADAIAETIAGVPDPQPFRPVLQGMLLTGADPLYIRAELGGSTTVSTEPLWSPPAKLVGRYVTSFLAAV
jgi:sulfide:quinone oxidoreductase